jgi:hypothetical protein
MRKRSTRGELNMRAGCILTGHEVRVEASESLAQGSCDGGDCRDSAQLKTTLSVSV